MDTKGFIEKAKLKHDDKYDYSKTKYINAMTEIIIICSIHGVFEQKPTNHLRGSGCYKCNPRINMGIDKFIEKAIKKHGDRYDYSKSEYINADTRMTIVCKEHGEFTQTPSKHLSGRGCRRCAAIKNAEKSSKTQEQFIKDAKKLHGDLYDYSAVEYKSNYKKVKIICPIHGGWNTTPANHILGKGRGCPECAGNVKITTKQFIEKAIKKHGNKYDYSKSIYTGAHDKIEIICPIHGSFKQTAASHTNSQNCGCPSCNESKGEMEVAEWLDGMDIKYIRQKRWSRCKDKNPLPFDFYIPSMNLAIEYDGEQHFISKPHWKTKLEDTQRRDAIKTKYCLDEGIKLLRINYTENILDRLKHIL